MWRFIDQNAGWFAINITPIHIERNGAILTNTEAIEILNNLFISMNADIPALDLTQLSAFLPAAEQVLLIHTYQACKKQFALKRFNYKAMQPRISDPAYKGICIRASRPCY